MATCQKSTQSAQESKRHCVRIKGGRTTSARLSAQLCFGWTQTDGINFFTPNPDPGDNDQMKTCFAKSEL